MGTAYLFVPRDCDNEPAGEGLPEGIDLRDEKVVTLTEWIASCLLLHPGCCLTYVP